MYQIEPESKISGKEMTENAIGVYDMGHLLILMRIKVYNLIKILSSFKNFQNLQYLTKKDALNFFEC